MKKLTLIIILMIAMLTSCESKKLTIEQELEDVTTYIDERLNEKAGTSVIITQNNKTLYTASNGLSSIELNSKNNIHTQYDLASIGKMFTGYCIAQLEVEGKISMDDDIRKYLKDFPTYDHKITVGHLVHHTSGIKNWTYLIYKMGWSNEDKITTEKLLRAIYAQKSLDFTPGEKYQYSNSGYVLLTEIIEVITNKDFVQYTKENIFDPLKMDKTFFNEDQNRLIEGMAQAYMFSNGERIREAYNTSALGSSSLISNALDMGKWMNFLLFPPKNKTAIVEKMFTTRKLNNGESNSYAYGIRFKEFNGITTIGHSGSWSSFTSYMAIVPKLKTGIFFANNYRTRTQPIMDLYLEVFAPDNKESENKNQSGKPKKDSKKEPEEKISLSTQQLDKYTGLYRLGDAWYLNISRKGNDLYTQATGERTFYMKPVNDSTFTVRAYGNREIVFKQNKYQKVDKLIYNKIEAPRKTSLSSLDAKEMKRYKGVYYSTELDLVFDFKIKNNKLIYSNIKNGTYELYVERDNFLFSDGPLNKLFFEKNNDKIIGFYLKNSRNKKLFYFNKAN